MSRAEALSVTQLSGECRQMGQVIAILRGKGNLEFNIFCNILRQSNYHVWADELERVAKQFERN